MVVLEEGSMLTTGHNQYLQPDYLSPLPTTLDAKKSPLALLAQTCSQIGADSPSKPLMSSLEKSSKGGSSAASNARSPPAAKLERTRSSPSDSGSKSSSSSSSSSSGSAGLAFKPYETNVVSKRTPVEEAPRPASKAGSVHSASGSSGLDSASCNSANNSEGLEATTVGGHAHQTTHGHGKKSSASRSTPLGRKSASPGSAHQHHSSHHHHSHQQQQGGSGPAGSNSSSPSVSERKSPGNEKPRSSASPRTSSSGASPIIRSGMEVLSGHSGKDSAAAAAAAAAAATASLQSMYKAGGLAAFGANSLCCPPGLAENPAFRPPFAGASPFSHHHAAAAALLGYPGPGAGAGAGAGSGAAANNPYLSYARVKTPSGGESLVPVCKDPYCTGCQYSVHNAQMMMAAASAGACPSGCSQCDHQKYGLMALSSLGPMPPPPPSLAGYPGSLAAAGGAAGGRAHVCNWIAGDSYCGKRFNTSEELLQHLRSHTSLTNGADPSAAAAAALIAAGQHSHPLLSPSAALHRAAAGSYPSPSLSPLGGRYHPYGKPPPTGPIPTSLPASLAASPYSAFNALGPYYSPYAIYGQRIGAAVHP